MYNRKSEDAFSRDVASDLQEDVLQRIVELAWSGKTSSGDGIEISSIEHINALNIDFNGTITIDGREHEFHIRDGNNAGTEIIAWNDEGRFAVELEPRPVPALVPASRQEVVTAIHFGRAAAFLSRWDADLDPSTERGRALHDLPTRQAYDAYFDPGPKPHFDLTAQSYGYRISDREEELVIREMLHEAELRFAPSDLADEDPEKTAEIFRRWAEMEDPAGPGVALRKRVAARLATMRGGAVSHEEREELSSMGFRFVNPEGESAAWSLALAPHLEAEQIEGFDTATLPEDPVRGIFAAFFRHTGENPNMDSRVDPVRAAAELLTVTVVGMGRKRSLDFPETAAERMELLGYRVKNLLPEIRPEADLSGPEM